MNKKILKQLLLPLLFVLLLAFATRGDNNIDKQLCIKSSNAFLENIYAKINFDSVNVLNFDAFKFAVKGFYNIKASGRLNQSKEILTICDFSLSANRKRMWVIDLKNLKLLFNDFVAHGQGTGEEFASAFSNKENSHQSSLGFFITGGSYIGQHGLSMFLHGIDQGFNSAAYSRSIVMHGAQYVSQNFIDQNLRLGRSWGCPAIRTELAFDLINITKDSTCLFIYFPDTTYLATSHWLKKNDNGFKLAKENQEYFLSPQIVSKEAQVISSNK